jgi:hypothetical protein
LNASSQCGELRKYSSASLGCTFSMRSGMIGMLLLTARSTSRSICGDVFAFSEKTSTIMRDWPMALTIDLAQPMPGMMSRGAIQQRKPRPSSAVQTASPAAMSLLDS